MADPSIVVETAAPLIDVLALLHPTAKRNSLRRMVDHGRVRVDGQKASRANMPLKTGSTVEVLARADGDKPLRKPKEEIPEPEVIYSDDEVIIVDKPAGLLSVATDHGEADTMFDRTAKWAWENGRSRALLVHRLDRDTSGCMIFARTPETKDFLQSQFKDRTIERIYHAVVHREPEAKSGSITLRIQESKDKRVRLVDKGKRAGREAITHWRLEKVGPAHSLIHIKIDTGRRAQIRLHMAHLGCPVAGDNRHGFGMASVNRLCLHATSLGFEHPDGERRVIGTEIPRLLLTELNRRLG